MTLHPPNEIDNAIIAVDLVEQMIAVGRLWEVNGGGS